MPSEEREPRRCPKCGSGLKDWDFEKREFTGRCFYCGHEEKAVD